VTEIRQKTLFFLKPDAVVRRNMGTRALKGILDLDCVIKNFAQVRASEEFLANSHYNLHRERHFFKWLTEFAAWGELVVLIIEGDQIIKRVREELGPTIVEQAIREKPFSLRAKYGICKGVNVAHASDSVSSASREISVWKKEFVLDSDDPNELVQSYISRYSRYEYVNTGHYRKLIFKLNENSDSQKSIENKISRLLQRENPDAAAKKIVSFSELITNAV